MKLVVLGLSHKTAPVALRERLSLDTDDLPDHLAALCGLEPVNEAAILSTCNRVEIYCASRDPESAVAAITHHLASDHQLDRSDLESHLYRLTEGEAVRHGFRVAASLDSQMVGEPQILGQMKDAYHLAVESKTTGLALNRFFQHAFRSAKRVRTETTIAENAVSIASAAVSLAKRIFGDLKGHSCLLVGAGEMCELAAQHMVTNGIDQVLVTNRTVERAHTLAHAFGGDAFPLEALPDRLHEADVVIASTGSRTPIVLAKHVKKALRRRRQRPMFFIDIAVPRDMDPAIAKLGSAFLYDIDDLTRIVEENRDDRARAATEAERIIDQEVPQFLAWLENLEVVPTLVDLRRSLESTRDRELEKLFKGWSDISETDRKRVESMSRALVNKILHTPLSQLKSLAADDNGDLYVDAVRLLFQLDGEPPSSGTSS
ncbi:MAG: glutamyl-tRNA reductase [Magnetococcales bacterium]|nr:glutamyl-tRNA reductase [Magnetococcales bacterium]